MIVYFTKILAAIALTKVACGSKDSDSKFLFSTSSPIFVRMDGSFFDEGAAGEKPLISSIFMIPPITLICIAVC